MTTQDWDKIFSFASEAYPAWKPKVETSLMWFSELKNYSFATVMASFRSVGVKLNSQFPPSLFQILSEIKKQSLNLEQVDELWELIIKKAGGRDYANTVLSVPAQRALHALGGTRRIGQVDTKEFPFLKKQFERAFEDFSESEISQSLLELTTEQQKRIEA